MSERVLCPTCGYPVPEGVRRCIRCGRPIEWVPCPNCGCLVPEGVQNCIRCGHSIDKGRPPGEISDPGNPPEEDEIGGANLPNNNGKEDSPKIKIENGKYHIDLGLEWIKGRIVMPDLKEEILKKEIENLLPEGFTFKEGLFSSDRPSHGVWVQKKRFGENSICCEVVRGHQDYRTPNGMSTWYWTYHISVWYTVGRFLGFSLGDEKELDAICRDIAQMIEDKYQVR